MRPAFTPAVFYRDPKAALRWLEQAAEQEQATGLTIRTGLEDGA